MIKEKIEETIDRRPILINISLATSVIITIMLATAIVVKDKTEIETQLARNTKDIERIEYKADKCCDTSLDAAHRTDLVTKDIQTIKESVKRLENFFLGPSKTGDYE